MNRYLFFLGVALLLASCKPYAFLPDLNVTPQLSQVNEFQAQVNTGSGSGFQAAFSPANHFGITANGYIMGKDSGSGNTVYRKRFGGSISAGYYYLLENALLFEAYGGVESGVNHAFGYSSEVSFGRYSHVTDYFINNRYHAVFISPTLAVIHDHFIGGFNVRFSGNYFYRNNDLQVRHEMDGDSIVRDEITRPGYPSPFILATPAIFIKAGSENLKGTFEIGLPVLLNKNGFDNATEKLFYPVVFRFGIEFRLK
jgi:hypothetical protein